MLMSRRDDTCTGKACPFWKRYREQCPNYVEGRWETKKGDIYTTRDCAPKRSMILLQQLYNLTEGARQDYAHVRKATVEVLQLAACNAGVEFIEGEVEEVKQIEDKSNGKDPD
jgi:hypothetical protein